MINYDTHWNSVRLMQRIGRVDRRMNPEVEKQLVSDHPEVASSRGKVSFRNFLPPDELNAIFSLYYRAVNATMARTYWHVGRLVVQHEHQGKARARYGDSVISSLATRQSLECGRGFDGPNLWYVRKCYWLSRF